MITLDQTAGGLRLATPYDVAFVEAFKQAVPYSARAWQKPFWIVDPAYGKTVVDLVYTFFGTRVTLPAAPATAVQAETRAIELLYLGRCKERGEGVSTAYGWVNDAWSVIFPETVLRAHFGAQDQKPGETPTLYSTLGIAKLSSADDLRRAYRRMARQWHPDVCKEPDANDQFLRIKRAYDILGDAVLRKKYDAGLALEASLSSTRRGAAGWDNAASSQYRAPLRCGFVLAEGAPKLGRFVVSKILDWQDIVKNGKTMVSSWDTENDRMQIDWV